MTLLDVIDLDRFRYNKKTNVLSHGRKWVRLWFGIYEKMNTKKKFQIEQKRKLLNMTVPDFLYTNSMLLLATRTTRTISFTFYKEFLLDPFHSK